MTERLRAAADRIGLPAWFIAIDLLWIIRPETLGIDARHYQRATSEWLAGGNPWAVSEGGIPFAAGPHTLLFYVPTSVLPLAASVALWMVVGACATIWLIRRLDLPLWWLLFPPLLHSAWNGNPQSLALALLVAGGSIAASVAVGLKLYAAVPLLGRWRDLLVASIALLVTLPLLPWQLYLDQGLGVGSHLQTAWNGSAWRLPVLIPFVLAGLWVLRRRGAEWYAVPALFPATQFYYVAMALPAIGRNRWLAAALAFPMVLVVPIVVIILALLELREGRSIQVRLPWDRPSGEAPPG